MKASLALGLAVLGFTNAAPPSQQALIDQLLVVDTLTGTYQGAINQSAPLVRHWLGVPFAQQPVGDLRFNYPQPLENSTSANSTAASIIDATNFGPNCPQYESTTPSLYNKIVREYFIWGDDGDDCLTVSIWAPLTPIEDAVPVFIWLYGGGELTGGSSVPYQNPQKWVQRTQAHIVVSVQYRLNFFAFPNAPAASGAANLALADARLATEWIRDNIAAFGGDPSRMVLWGQSAGGQLAGELDVAYPDDPIVTGFIQESGNIYGQATAYTDLDHTNFTFIAEAFGCAGDATNQTACLQGRPQADIESFIQYWQDSDKTPALSFLYQANNVTDFTNYTAEYVSGHFSKLPKILAYNKMDGASFAPLPPPPYDTAPNATSELDHTLYIHCPINLESYLRTTLGVTTYRYMYSGNFSNISPYFWMGAYHSSELPMLMGTYGDFRGVGTPFEAEVSQTMQDFYLAFVRDPENGLADAGWPKYSEGLVEVFGESDANGTDVVHTTISSATLDAVCIGYNGET